jgi:hypothetical protein
VKHYTAVAQNTSFKKFFEIRNHFKKLQTRQRAILLMIIPITWTVVTLSKTPSARNQIKVAAISENQKTRVSAIRDKQTKVSANRGK